MPDLDDEQNEMDDDSVRKYLRFVRVLSMCELMDILASHYIVAAVASGSQLK